MPVRAYKTAVFCLEGASLKAMAILDPEYAAHLGRPENVDANAVRGALSTALGFQEFTDVQIFDDGGRSRTVQMPPQVFIPIHDPDKKTFYLVSHENYRGEFFVPEDARILEGSDLKEYEELNGSRALTEWRLEYNNFGVPTEIDFPTDFDPEKHITSTQQLPYFIEAPPNASLAQPLHQEPS